MQTTSATSVVQGSTKMIPGVTQKYDFLVEVFTIHIPAKPEQILVYKKDGSINYYKDPVTKMPILGPDGQPVPKLVSDVKVIRKMTLTARPELYHCLPPLCTRNMRVTLMFNTPRVPCSQCLRDREWGLLLAQEAGEMTQLPEELTRVCTHGKGGNGVQVEKEDRRAIYNISCVKETHPTWFEVERSQKSGSPPPPVKFDMETITKKDKLGFEKEVTQMKYTPLANRKVTKGQEPMGYLECHNFLKWLLGDKVMYAMDELRNNKPNQ